ncbi:MAG: O-antigen ligase family protein [Spirochaetes bacterium]|nr:O-antigen ligase family protein [Spirochaetota bacterium]
MKKHFPLRIVYLILSLISAVIIYFFYFKYIPFINTFNLILFPILFLVLLCTVYRVESGILVFVFIFPLINNLPYFFGIDWNIPHAPTALVLFLFFFLGWLIHSFLRPPQLDFSHPIFKPMVIFTLVVFISAVLTLARFTNFFPFLSNRIYELPVNINGVRVGGAVMSVIFSSLNYITGFLFFVILYQTIKTKEIFKKIMLVFSVSILISLFFALVQKYFSLSLGNTSFWINIERINATFKDPNSFGVVLSSYLPLVFGMIFFYNKKLRPFFIFLIIFGLFIFPSIGSRSGLLGLGISIFTFFILYFARSEISLKKKLMFVFSVFLASILVAGSFYFISSQSNLYKRIGWSIDVFNRQESLNKLFTRRLDFWTAGLNMVEDYPLTGVGIGSFIIELPNYLNQMGKPFRFTDSGENYFFQVGSELGLIGLIIILWLFYEIFKLMKKGWQEKEKKSKDKFILIGIISSIFSLFINYIFHSYIGAFAVKYFFWLLIAGLCVFSNKAEGSILFTRSNKKFLIITLVILIIFGAVNLVNTMGSLSLQFQAEKYGWDQNFGLYSAEKDDRGFLFNWAKRSAGISVDNLGPILIIPVLASHPDIKSNPVNVRIFLSDTYFRKNRLLKEIILRENKWVEFEYPVQNFNKDKIHLVFETDRTWQPLKYLNVMDSRHLAIGLGKEYFRYPHKIPEDRINKIERISWKSWEGKQKNRLWSNGEGRIEFESDEQKVAIRLNVKIQIAHDLGPYIILRMDEKVIGKCMLNEEGWRSIVFIQELSRGKHIFSVEYINDFHDIQKELDRNILLGDLEIVYLK